MAINNTGYYMYEYQLFLLFRNASNSTFSSGIYPLPTFLSLIKTLGNIQVLK